MGRMLHVPFKIEPWARHEPAPLDIEDLRPGDILVAPTGSLWQVALHRRPYHGRLFIHTASSANKYVTNEDLHEWQIVVNNHDGLPLDYRL